MSEDELRSNLTDIRDRLNVALDTPHEIAIPEPIPALADASYDESTVATGV